MAKKAWIGVPVDLFQNPKIKKLRKDQNGDGYLIIYLKLQLLQIWQGNKTSINLCDVATIARLINEEEQFVYAAIRVLQKIGLISIRDDGCIETGAYGRIIDPRQRSSAEYVQWRTSVFERDDYTCQLCAKRGVRLEAHHKKSWAKHPELRYEVSNGITLCYECHKMLHRNKRG